MNWDKLIESNLINSIYFSSYFIEYEKEVLNVLESQIIFVFKKDIKFVYKIYETNDKLYFTLLNFNRSSSQIKLNLSKKYIDFISNKVSKKSIKLIEIPPTDSDKTYQKMLLKDRINFQFKIELYTDLTLSVDNLWSSIRKSYRSIINKNLDKVVHIENCNLKLWNLCKELHIKVSGKQTRSDYSWKILYKFLNSNKAFLLCMFSGDKLIGYSFFHINKNMIVYGIAAYDRDYYSNISISHSFLWKAIQIGKRSNLDLIYLGDFYKTNDKKLSSIMSFKKGFSNYFISGLIPE
ncbi:hypothetical protein N9L61_01130 [Flavobacteriaceae bacterium]|nr:hypothetical protein [Flavobacteriaceae bacterium]